MLGWSFFTPRLRGCFALWGDDTINGFHSKLIRRSTTTVVDFVGHANGSNASLVVLESEVFLGSELLVGNVPEFICPSTQCTQTSLFFLALFVAKKCSNTRQNAGRTNPRRGSNEHGDPPVFLDRKIDVDPTE